MKILICGGRKTDNIVKALTKKQQSGNIDIDSLQSLTEIGDLFERGSYFDRALIMAESITCDNTIQDEYIIRNNLRDFVELFKSKCTRSTTLIFVCKAERIAEIISDETIEISVSLRVIVREQPLDTKFMVKLMTATLDSVPKNMLYEPKTDQSNNKIVYKDKKDVEAKVSNLTSAKEVDVSSFMEHVQKRDEPAKVSTLDIDSAFYDEDDNNDEFSDFEESVINLGVSEGEFDFGEVDEEPKIEKEKFKPKKAIIQSAGIEEDTKVVTVDETVQEDSDFIDGIEEEYEEEETEEQYIDEDDFDTEETIEEETDGDYSITEPSEKGKEVLLEEEPEEYEINTSGFQGLADETEDEEIEEQSETETEELGESEEPEFGESDEWETEVGTANVEGEEEYSFGNIDDFEVEEEMEDNSIEDEENDRELTEDDIDLCQFGAEDISTETGEIQEVEVDDSMPDIQDLYALEDSLYSTSPKEEEKDVEVQSLFDGFESEEDTDEKPFENEETAPFEEEPEPVKKKGLFGRKKPAPKPVQKPTPKATPKNQHIQQVQERVIPRNSKAGRGSGRESLDRIISQLEELMPSYRSRGCSIVITGGNGSGKSTVAFNVAKLISDMNYNVLIVDFDTLRRSQSYITKECYDAVHSMQTDNPSLKMAINANAHITRHTNIVAPGLHLLTMGLGSDWVNLETLLSKQKISKFSSMVRNNYNFIIYDMPFNYAVGHCEDIVTTADHAVILTEYGSKGVMELLTLMTNIESEDMQETMFTRTSLCFNKFTGYNKILGKRVKRSADVLKVMDDMVLDLLGSEGEFSFRDMHLISEIKLDNRYEDCWFSSKAFVDFPDGKADYTEWLGSILLNDWRD